MWRYVTPGCGRRSWEPPPGQRVRFVGEPWSSWAEPKWISTGKGPHGKRSQMWDRVLSLAPAEPPDQSNSCGSCADEPTAGVRWETLELRPDQIPADPGWRHKAAFTEPLPSVRTCSARPSSVEPADLRTPRREKSWFPASVFPC